MVIDPEDLIELQNSTKPIRNPFGFDFIFSWNKRKGVLKGDGKWKDYYGSLRDHIARHLYMKIFYQYHDEQVEKMRETGNERGARKFRVSDNIKDKIWMLITGDPYRPESKPENVEENVQADLKELRSSLAHVDQEASNRGELHNVSALIEQANAQAAPAAKAGKTGHKSGVAEFGPEELGIEPSEKTPEEIAIENSIEAEPVPTEVAVEAMPAQEETPEVAEQPEPIADQVEATQETPEPVPAEAPAQEFAEVNKLD